MRCNEECCLGGLAMHAAQSPHGLTVYPSGLRELADGSLGSRAEALTGLAQHWQVRLHPLQACLHLSHNDNV